MREVTPETAADYLRDAGLAPPGAGVEARALGWGVSNVVIRVDVAGRDPLVLKQSRGQLRTQAEWFSRLERIWTEAAALRLLGEVLPPGSVPAVVFEDRENYLFAMTSAPDDAQVWKEQLLAGRVEPEVARRAGDILGAMHAATAGRPELAGPLADTAVFDELRLDPFYRKVASTHPDLAGPIEALLGPPPSPAERTFVHADFSPKNILVDGRGVLTVVDFETAHAGDPAFDLGFLLSHLILKAIRAARAEGPGPGVYLDLARAAMGAYHARAGVGPGDPRVARGVAHAAACVLARVDGKSPVDYLDGPGREAARRLGRSALLDPPGGWDGLLDRSAREMPPGPDGTGSETSLTR